MTGFNWFDWFVFAMRMATMLLSASFAATMLRYTFRMWRVIATAERAWTAGLIILSINLATYVALIVGNGAAVFPDSLSWVVFSLAYVWLWRGLILSKPERH